MKKVSTAAVTATKNFSQAKLTIGLESGGSIELVLRTGRNRGSATGTESEHDSQGDARGVRKHAALSHRAGDGDALSLGASTAERTGARGDRGASLVGEWRGLRTAAK